MFVLLTFCGRTAEDSASAHRFFSLDSIAKAVADINYVHDELQNTNKVAMN